MKENVGGADRVGRAVVGSALLVLGFTKMGARDGAPLGLLVMLSGALLAETAITKVCPLNEVLGVDTARRVSLA